MARRRPPATTPFGAWLSEWLDDHADDWTVEAFATECGVSPSAVSLWLTKTKRVEVDNLREVARVTGEDFDVLYRMVYTRKAPALPAPITADVVAEIEERMRVAFREELRAALAELRPGGSG